MRSKGVKCAKHSRLSTVTAQISNRDLANRVLAAFPGTRRIVLFGMHLPDEAHPNREIDLLVVTPTALRPTLRSALLRKVLKEFHVSFKLLVVTPDEFERLRNVPDGVVARALVEGTTLHEARDAAIDGRN